MGKLFDLNNPVMRGLSEIANIILLSCAWLVCSIPIITIGPAFSEHDFTDRMGGAYPLSDKHYTVYFTAYTPVERIVKIRAKRKDGHL